MQGSMKCTSSQWANAQKVLPHKRLLNADGRIDIVRLGHANDLWRDRYHTMLTMPWHSFFLWMGLVYLVANTLFALGYLLGGDAIANARPGSFADAFFFSVQTMASIGYGAMYPQTLYANLLVTIESLVGLMGIAMVTGLTFARFSRPTTRVMFSNIAVISPYEGTPTLMFRAANQRRNRIIEAQLSMTLVWNEISQEGHAMRRFYDLPLVRSQTPVFALTWTIMHPITSDSPLYGKTDQDLFYADAELVITLTGLDETLSQTVHARHSYGPTDILRNMIFVDLFTHLPDGRFAIDYDRFHQVRSVFSNTSLPDI
ncbi:MAG: ATP-sensitive inward rectifier potassium channel 10 [Cyanothece sp. SIO2G6]|nr:ATP-sensitive inward rectifier potassium channel 10 [Cyanothece sp. SIO2G6]